MKHRTTLTPTDDNFFIYWATPLRTHLLTTFKLRDGAFAYAKQESETREHVVSVVNSNGVCLGKYSAGKYYI